MKASNDGSTAVVSLTAKHLYCNLPLPLLKKLGVKRFLQMPGYAVLTYPVSNFSADSLVLDSVTLLFDRLLEASDDSSQIIIHMHGTSETTFLIVSAV